MAQRRKGPVERLIEWASTPRGDWALGTVEEKGLAFPHDPHQGYLSNWSGPSFPLNTSGYFGGGVDYKVAAGDLIDSSVVMTCLNWLLRVFPRARCRVVLETEDGLEPVKGHALTKLLKRPNPVYSGTQLWRCTVLSYNWNGNAYWRKVRNSANQVIELWYEPHFTIRPVRASGADFVSYYQVWRGREWQRIEKEDVVHFRWVLSPKQQMVGMGPIDSGLREVFADNAAAQFTAAMWRNYGVFSRMISPKEGDAPLSYGELVRIIAEFQASTTGDNRGRAIGSTVPIEVHEGTADASKMDTRENRKSPEERIAGLIGIHPAVVGLGAGLDRSTFSNAEEAEKWAYKNNILPAYDSFAEELDIQLVPDFTAIEEETVEFDTTKIEVLQGDIVKKRESIGNLYSIGLITRATGLLELGYKPATDGSDDVRRLSPLLEVALLNQGRVSPDVIGAVTEDGELKPEGQQDAPTALESGGKSTNGHSPTPHEWAALLLPEGKAKGKVDRERQAIEDELIEDIAGELSDLYAEAEGKI